EGFSAAAERALAWNKLEIEAPNPSAEAAARRLRFLSRLPLTHQEGDFLFVHGSPRDPLHEYVYPEQARDQAKMGVLFWMVPRCCFMGHTHRPGIFTSEFQFHKPTEIGDFYRLGSGKAMCNVGSVGQPRDGDMRASYVLLNGDTIYFRRVEYDVATTRKKVKA